LGTIQTTRSREELSLPIRQYGSTVRQAKSCAVSFSYDAIVMQRYTKAAHTVDKKTHTTKKDIGEK
jgi:hypothetical protein